MWSTITHIISVQPFLCESVHEYCGAQVSENAALSFPPASMAVWGEEEVAVGGEDHKVYIYSLLDPAQPKATLEGPRGKVGG